MRELKFVVEIWRPCPNYENCYEVSNFGNVRGIDRICGFKKSIIKGVTLKKYTNRKGYLEVRLSKNSKSCFKVIHRLIAKSFIPNLLNLPQVNHKDGDKTNNNEWNLEWSNNSENQKHAYRMGLQPSRAGENNSNSELKDEEVTNLKHLYNSGKSIKEIVQLTDVSISKMRAIIYGTSWKSNTTEIMKRDDRKTKKPNEKRSKFLVLST